MQDLVFIGGGLSGTLTLVHFVRELQARLATTRSSGRRLRVTMLDRNGAFGRGVPYARSEDSVNLLNNNVSRMNVFDFVRWLGRQEQRWRGMLETQPGNGGRAWLNRNAAALAMAERDPAHGLSLYLPRSVYGLFMEDVLRTALDQAERAAVASVRLVTAEAVSLKREAADRLRITLRNGDVIRSRRVVLGLGSLPPDPAPHLETAPGYIHDFSRLCSGTACRRLLDGALASQSTLPSAVIIGSNAAAMEAIHTIRTHPELFARFSRIVVISPSGCLPDGRPSRRQPPFKARHTVGVGACERVSADQLFAALLRDVEEGRLAGYSSLDYSQPICDGFREVFMGISVVERRRFVEEYGMRFTALNRHTPPEYADAARHLRGAGKLQTLRARLIDVTPPDAHCLEFSVRAALEDGTETRLRAAVVINCRGSGTLRLTRDQLLREILGPGSDIARSNSTGAGIAVTGDFEASPGMYVVGPLLAGHTTETDHIWNLEDAQRINDLTQRVAAIIANHVLNGDRAGRYELAFQN